MEAAIKELQETAIVMAGIQSRQAEMLKDHAEWLQSHDRAMIEILENGRKTDERIDRLQAEARERGQIIDQRIEKLVIAIGELVRARN
jgi:hypothetical protein